MGDKTGIGWTNKTWNPWMGCTKVSPGCAHCYMFREQTRYGNDPELVRRSKTKFNDPLKWKEPALVFTCSWSDWFHEAADAWRDEAWDIVKRTPHLTYQILTKRPERIAEHLPSDWGEGYANVWLGTSVENQRWIHRIARLVEIPARVRFVSAEPLLGPLDFYGAGSRGAEDGDPYAFSALRGTDGCEPPIPGIDWVIVGGESGTGCRPMREEWARSIRDHCAVTNTAFYLKQLGGHPNPRSHAEAVLDGRTHTEFPAGGTADA